MISSVVSATSAPSVQKTTTPAPQPAPAPTPKAAGNDGDADDGGSAMKLTTVSSGAQSVLSGLKVGG